MTDTESEQERPRTDPIGFLRHRIENGMPLYQGDVDSALAVARTEGRQQAVPTPVQRCDCGDPWPCDLHADPNMLLSPRQTNDRE